jgi:hypothetical protein
MTINRKQVSQWIYRVRNASGEDKRLILEHPITQGTSLLEPDAPEERTANLYRFVRTLPAGKELSFTVKEERPVFERFTLARFSLDTLVSYASNGELPEAARQVLQEAAALRRQVEDARTVLSALESRRSRLIGEQERTRQNLIAAGNQSVEGQEYLKRLAAQDLEIDGLSTQVGAAEKAVQAAQEAYDQFASTLTLL